MHSTANRVVFIVNRCWISLYWWFLWTNKFILLWLMDLLHQYIDCDDYDACAEDTFDSSKDCVYTGICCINATMIQVYQWLLYSRNWMYPYLCIVLWICLCSRQLWPHVVCETLKYVVMIMMLVPMILVMIIKDVSVLRLSMPVRMCCF
jgi:hypothetical protein